MIEEKFSVIEEDSVSYKLGAIKIYRIIGPDGPMFSAYAKKEDAEEVCLKLNSKPYFDAKAFCDEINTRKQKEKLAKLD